MKSHEHRAVGEAATGGALVQVGGDSAEERFVLSYGDVVALSGDFFVSHHSGAHAVEDTQVGPEAPNVRRRIVEFSHRRHHGDDRGHGGRGDAAPRGGGLPPAGLSGTRRLRGATSPGRASLSFLTDGQATAYGRFAPSDR